MSEIPQNLDLSFLRDRKAQKRIAAIASVNARGVSFNLSPRRSARQCRGCWVVAAARPCPVAVPTPIPSCLMSDAESK
jgi:hypothetical protein